MTKRVISQPEKDDEAEEDAKRCGAQVIYTAVQRASAGACKKVIDTFRADVSAGLPRALAALGHEVRIALPASPAARAALAESRELGPGSGLSGTTLVGGRLPATELSVTLVDASALFERPGAPYGDAPGRLAGTTAQRHGRRFQLAAQRRAVSRGLSPRAGGQDGSALKPLC